MMNLLNLEKNLGTFLLFLSILASSNLVYSQNSDCSSVGFETMSANADQVVVPGWQLWTGRNDVAGPYTIEDAETHSTTDCSANFTSHTPGSHCGVGGTGVKVYNNDYQHHDIKSGTTGNINDLINVPPLPNLSGSNSRCIRLGGQQQAGLQAAGMSTTYTVDPANPYLAYHYILRFENTGHTVDNRGFAYLRIKDDQGNIINCGSFETYEDNSNETWSYDNGWDTWYMPDWRTWIVDLNNFAGQTLDIEVWVADCQEGAHAGWGYFDFECLPTAIPDCSTVPCMNNPTLNLANNSITTCVTDPVSLGNATFGGGASQITISHNGNGTLSQTSASSSPTNITYTPTAGDAGNTVTITYTTDAPPGCSPLTETIDLTITPIITPSFPSFGPYCVGDPANVLPTTSNEGITGSWNGTISTTSAGSNSFTFTPNPGQCADPATISVDVFNCTPLEVCLENNGDITVSGGDGPYSWDEQGNVTSTVNITNEQECIDCPGASPNYFFGIYTGCSQSTCTITTTGWVNFASGTTVTPTGNYPIQITDVNGQTLTITDPNAIPLCSGCTPPNLITDDLTACSPNTVDLNNAVNGASDSGNISFYNNLNDANAATNAIGPTVASSGTYYVRLENSADPNCFSVSQVNVTITPDYNLTENISACENSTVTYPDGTTATITSNTTYTSNLTSAAGCDSVITTNVTMIIATNSTENVNICSGSNYTYPDGTVSNNITSNESHTSVLTNIGGCDSTITTNVTVGPAISTTENATICSGLNYTYPDGTVSNNVTANETHVSTLLSVSGCDSVITTNLTVLLADIITENVTICSGANYVYPDGTISNNITANETHTSALTNVSGCDSIITTNIIISSAFTSTENINICSGTNYTYPDGTISNNITANESHNSVFVSIMGCDSIITTNLNVNPVYTITENISVCENAMVTYPDGTTAVILANTSYTSNLLSINGCDSIITTNVSMLAITNTTENFTVCTGSNFTYPDGTVSLNITVNESHVSNLTSVNGCDSILTTNLVVGPAFTSTQNVNICSGGSYTYPDGTVSTNITVNETQVSSFISVGGCDSIITTNVNVLPVYNISENIMTCENSTYTFPDGTSSLITNNMVYTSNLTTTLGCDSIVVTNITMVPLSTVTESISVCENTNLTFPDGNNQVITSSTSYTSTLTSQAGCDSIIITNVTMIPNFSFTENVSVCEGDNYTLPDGTVMTNLLTNQSYTSIMTNQLGCDSIITTNIQVNPLPIINAGPDQLICENEWVTLSASGGLSYTWTSGVTDGLPFQISSTSTYTVIGTDANGCSNSDDVLISVNPMPIVDFMADNTSGCAPLTINFTNLTNIPGVGCSWDMGDGTIINTCGNVSYTYDYPGTYTITLTVTTNAGCSSTTTYDNYISVHENAHASFTASEYQVDLNDTEVNFTNNSVNADTYIWNFGDGLGSNEENPTHEYPEQGNSTYDVMLIANNAYNCPDTAYSSITVMDELIYYVPNVFSPDGDQYNNTFQPVFTSGYDPYDFHLMIFNRWGELIFESYNADIGWDGTYGDGSLVQDGVYVWKINFKESMTDKKYEIYGHVTVLK